MRTQKGRTATLCSMPQVDGTHTSLQCVQGAIRQKHIFFPKVSSIIEALPQKFFVEELTSLPLDLLNAANIRIYLLASKSLGKKNVNKQKKAPRNGGAKFNCTNFFLKDMRCYMRQTNVFLFRYYFLMSHPTKKNLLNLNRCC